MRGRRRKGRRPAEPEVGRREAWGQAAAELDGELEEGRKEGDDRILVRHGPWTVTVRTYTVMVGQVPVTYTSARALYLAHGPVSLVVRKRNAIDKLVERIGFRPAPRGNPMLMRSHVAKCRPESRLLAVVTPTVTDLLLRHDEVRLEVKKGDRKDRKSLGERAAQVVAVSMGVVTDTTRLADMVRLTCAELDALEACGLALREAAERP